MGVVMEITRQTGLKAENGASVMLSKDGTSVVATASSDSAVSSDGTMRSKEGGGARRANRRCALPLDPEVGGREPSRSISSLCCIVLRVLMLLCRSRTMHRGAHRDGSGA